jgi:putative ABC transport system ATP-binding protein
MLELRDVRKTFNRGTANEKVALQGISLVVEDGDFITVIGGNGAGKSTMLNMISGAFPVDAGLIKIGKENVTNQPEHIRAKRIGRVFQDPMKGTAGDMWIEENLAIALRRGKKRGLKWGVKKEERALYKKLLAPFDLGLEDRLQTKVSLLSGGQRQALTLLMATLEKPDVLLLDEHTAALDPKTAAKVLAMTDEVIREHNLTAIMVTHNMKDAIKYGNRLIMMMNGKIIYDVSGEEKAKLEVSDLLKKFEISAGEEFSNDRMLLV